MKRKIAALLMALFLLAAAALPAFAIAFGDPTAGANNAGAVAAAFRTDLQSAAAAGKKIALAFRSLEKSMGPFLKREVFTLENGEKLAQLSSKLLKKTWKLMTGTNEIEQAAAPEESASLPETLQKLAAVLGRQLYVQVENPRAAAQYIADGSGIDYDVIEGEGGTYYLHVDIEKNPQIFNYVVFRSLVDDLAEKQNAEMQKDPNGNYDYVMTYEHIAGELAFHMLVWAGADGIVQATGSENEQLLRICRSAAVADLDATENRLPEEVFSIVGLVLYNFFFFNTLHALGVIPG